MSQETIEVCDNCHKHFPQSKIATHFGYCRRNIKMCNQCGEMYDINFLEEHQEEFHKMAQCKFCQKPFKPNEVSKHQFICDARTQFCEYCELNVPMKDYPPHLKQCESRTKQCQKCHKPITNKDFLIHSISCQGIIQQPIIPITTNKYNNYQQYLKENQRKQPRKEQIPIGRRQQKKYEYKPMIMEQKRQPSRGGMEKQRKPEINYLNNRLGEFKKEIGGQTYKSSSITAQQKTTTTTTTNYADINMNKNIPSYDKKVPNISQKDKYGRVDYGSKNVDLGKNNISIGRAGDSKLSGVPSSKTNTNNINNNDYQPSSMMNNYGVRKPTNQPQSIKITPSMNGRNYQQPTTITTNQVPSRSAQQQLTNNYPKVPENYKKEIPQKKDVFMKRQGEKIMQPEQKKDVYKYGEYNRGDYETDEVLNGFKKDDARKYKDQVRPRPNQQPSQPQPQPHTRPSDRQRGQSPPFIPQQPVAPSYSSGMGDFQQDQMMQQAIMASLGKMSLSKTPKTSIPSNQRNQPKYKIDQVPADLVQTDMLNESFYGNQMAIMQEIERNKNNKRR